MKIAIVSQPWEAINQKAVGASSIATITYRLARGLAEQDEVVIYAKRREGQAATERDDKGILYRRIDTRMEKNLLTPLVIADRVTSFFNPRIPLVATSWYYKRYATEVARDIHTQGCDIVHLHNFSQFAPIIRKYNPNARIVLHMHCQWLTQLSERALARRLEDVDLVLGCSDYITDGARERFPRYAGRFATLFNGVQIPEKDLPLDPRAADAPLRLLYVGRLSPEKGVHVLIDAFNRIAEQVPNVHLDVVGPPGLLAYNFLVGLSDDDKTANLKRFYGRSLSEKIRIQLIEKEKSYLAYLKRIQTPDAAARTTYHGYVPHGERMDAFYRNADLFVLPSVCNEAFGMTPAEAMVFGVPSVVARSGGVVEVIDEGVTGTVVERDDPQAMADAVVRFLRDASLRTSMRDACQKRARALFGWNVLAGELRAIYASLLADAPQTRTPATLAS
ncbi:MAG: glycosyltransferase family 4 protein [Rhodothermales bacterium]